MKETLGDFFKELGLNQYETDAYVVLLNGGRFTAREVSRCSGISYSKVYSVLCALAKKGFCCCTPERPYHYQAISLKEAVHSSLVYLESKSRMLEKLLKKDYSSHSAIPEYRCALLYGRTAAVKKIRTLLERAKHHVCIVTTARGISRMLFFNDVLRTLYSLGVKIDIFAPLSHLNSDDAKHLHGLVHHIETCHAQYVSVDSKECLLMECYPDDENACKGEDVSFHIFSQTIVALCDHFVIKKTSE